MACSAAPRSVRVVPGHQAPADVSISGTKRDFAALLSDPGQLWNLVYGASLRIRGDVSLAMGVINCV